MQKINGSDKSLNLRSDDYTLFDTKHLAPQERIQNSLEIKMHGHKEKSRLEVATMGVSTMMSGTSFHWSSGYGAEKYSPNGSYQQTKAHFKRQLSSVSNCDALNKKLDSLLVALSKTSFSPIGLSILVSFDQQGQFRDITVIDPAHGFSNADMKRSPEHSKTIQDLQLKYQRGCINAIFDMKDIIEKGKQTLEAKEQSQSRSARPRTADIEDDVSKYVAKSASPPRAGSPVRVTELDSALPHRPDSSP